MVKVLVADDDLDIHELMQDILEITFKNVTVERALSCESLYDKIKNAKTKYNIILINMKLDNESGEEVVFKVLEIDQSLEERIVLFVGNSPIINPRLQGFPTISKPFSLDHFGEIFKKTCLA